MYKLRAIFLVIFACGIIAVGAWGFISLVRIIWAALIDVNPQLAVGVVAAAATLLASTATVVLGRYYERKKEIEAHFRAEKIKIYDDFLGELFKLFEDDTEKEGSTDMVKFLRQWQRRLVLWGGSNVLATYFKWMSRLKRGAYDADTIFLMDDFFRALRADIGQSSSGLSRGSFAHLILRNADLFLAQAARNPRITLEELGRIEKELDKQ